MSLNEPEKREKCPILRGKVSSSTIKCPLKGSPTPCKGFTTEFITPRDAFVRGKSHINDIESFWSFVKRRLAKLNGLGGTKFFLPLKACEYRFNNRDKHLEQKAPKITRKFKLCYPRP